MSQKATRKTLTEEKDKKPDSPVIELKSKPAPNKSAVLDKSTDKTDKAKTDKAGEKKVDKNGTDKEKDSKEKGQEKVAEKTVKPSASQQKPKETTIAAKPKDATSTPKPKEGTNTAKPKDGTNTAKPKDGTNASKSATTTNGTEPKTPESNTKPASNGTSPYSPTSNGSAENGVSTVNSVVTVSDSDEDDSMFPELTYDDSDVEPQDGGRSLTRRAQVMVTRTPETPRPASDKDKADKDKLTEGSAAASKDSKVLQLKDGVTDRKLRSADSPKPETKKPETPKKETTSSTAMDDTNGGLEVQVTVEIESEDEPRKTDTNYSKSRVKVSPYRRSGRLADQTTSSTQANYTGNNTTMETDISVSSLATEEHSFDDSYLRTIRGMRGRRSYKLLKDIQITPRPKPVLSESSRPTAPVVGRKRKPEAEDSNDIEQAAEVLESPPVVTKRMRLLDRISLPFRRTASHAPIVGINTDLPLTAPVASPAFDPETLKAGADIPPAVPLPTPTSPTDGKRCTIM